MVRHAKLVYQTPDGAEHEHFLDAATPTSVGRHPDCSITVTQPSVSRRHARVWHEAGGFFVEDLGSSNGTYINNQRVTRATLTDGCELRCGDFLMRYTTLTGVESPAPASKKPRVVGSLRPRRRDIPEAAAISARPTANRPALRDSPPPPPPEANLRPAEPNLRPAGRLKPAGRLDASRPPAEPIERPSRASAARPPAVTGEDELSRLRRELAHWKAQAEGRALIDGPPAESPEIEPLRQALSDRERDVEDRTRRIRDLEDEVRRLEEQLETQTEKALQLREQTKELQAQVEAYRREKADLEVDLQDTREALEEVRGAQQAAGGREQELAEGINDLKRKVVQGQKASKELERDLQLVEYDLKAAREENENLRLALGDDDSARKELNTTIDHLRQVLAEKESMIETLQRDVERLEERLTQAQEQARLDAGQRVAQLSEELAAAEAARQELEEQARSRVARFQALEEQVQARDAEIQALEAKAAEAGGQRGNAREMKKQLDQLRRDNRDLRNRIDEADKAGPAAELEAALVAAREARDAAKAEAERLRNQQAAAPAAPAATGDFEALRDAAVGTFEALNDLASDLRNNIRVGGDYVRELAGLVELAAKRPDDAAALKAAAEEIDALLTVESAVETLGHAQSGARDFKKAMRQFRDVLRRFGYGG